LAINVSLLIDEYRKAWALRYLRESRADLVKAEEIPIPDISTNFALVSMKKAQTALYFSLGDPEHLSLVVKEALEGRVKTSDSLMSLLTQTEWFIHTRREIAEQLRREAVVEDARQLLEIASYVVGLMIGRNVR
jgi:hypothetical protein